MSKTEREMKVLQQRRLRAGRLLARGVAQVEVARQVGVSRTTVSEWSERLTDGGLEALNPRLRGRPSGLDETQRRTLIGLLKSGALAAGSATELWTLPRVRELIKNEFGRAYSESQGRRILVALAFSRQRLSGRARERDKPSIKQWKLKRWPVQKNAARQGRIIVFIDESGLSERPTRVRTWAPRGETPMLQYHFNWNQLSILVGISFRRFYFRFYPGEIKSPQIIEFMHALGRQIRRPLLIIWDGLAAHWCALVRDYLGSLNGAVQVERLPAYAPATASVRCSVADP